MMLRPSRRSTLEAGTEDTGATEGLLKAPKPPKLAAAAGAGAGAGAALLRPEKRSRLAEAGAGTEAGAELKSANKSCEACGAGAAWRDAGAALGGDSNFW